MKNIQQIIDSLDGTIEYGDSIELIDGNVCMVLRVTKNKVLVQHHSGWSRWVTRKSVKNLTVT